MAAEGWRTQDGRHLALSERQRQVLALLAEGRTNAEIGERLGMTLDGAKWHVSEIISKLGVRSREEAAAFWRRQQRPPARLVRRLAGLGAWRWLAAGVGALAAAGIATVVIAAALRSGDAPRPATTTVEAATGEPLPTATTVPTETSLTAEEILHRSEQAMAAIPLVRVESHGWPRHPEATPSGVSVHEYSRTTMRVLRVPGHEGIECSVGKLPGSPFTDRSLGALAVYPEENHGATAPATFELLGEGTIDGEDAWVIRYAFAFPSIETPVLVEDTEWIAKDDYRLLRRERETHDAYGFIGQIVEILQPVDAPSPDCPVTPTHEVEDLRPLTIPRLAPPHPSVGGSAGS